MQPCQLIRQSRLLGVRYNHAAWLGSRNFGTTASLSRGKSKKSSGPSKALKIVQQGLPPSPPPTPSSKRSPKPPAPKKFKGTFNPLDHFLKKKQRLVDSPDFIMIVRRWLSTIQAVLQERSQDLTGWAEFQTLVNGAFSTDPTPLQSQLKADIERAFMTSNKENKAIAALKGHFEKHHYDMKHAGREAWEQQKFLNFRYPQEWYPAARAMKRHIHLHVGPTNSGKTYHALKRLESAQSGFYGGPLRLLAHEVYTRLNNKNISCGLLTGDEVRIPDGKPPRIYSNTVEMVPLGQDVDVGVIDEIQMIGDVSRGWAWTRALLGARAKELHLCGEERTVNLIQELTASMGDKLTIHRYQRLSPLKVMDKSLRGDWSKLEKGDCIVAFSRLTIHELKSQIEKATGRRVAIVYGSLPPEIRSQQADHFNNPDNDYDFLVASDAIGMGLNLSCKRIIFETTRKGIPGKEQRLTIPEVKQIGGRAGRYRPASSTASTGENVGYVTSLFPSDLPHIQMAMNTEAEPIEAAGLLPLDQMIKVYAENFDQYTPLHYILARLQRHALTSPHYFLCEMKSQEMSCQMLRDIPNLTIDDMLVFAAAPISNKMEVSARAFAECIANSTDGKLLEIPALNLDILAEKVSDKRSYLMNLEALHRSLVLYLWLSYRCGGVFIDRSLVTHVKEIAEVKMERALTEFSSNHALRRASTRARAATVTEQLRESLKEAQSDRSLLPEDGTEEAEAEEFIGATDEPTLKMATDNNGRVVIS